MALATGSGNPHLVYQAAYAVARAGWIADVSPAYVQQQTAIATADGLLAYNLAAARGTRNIARAQADETFALSLNTQEQTLTLAAIAPSQTHQAALATLDRTRREQAADHTGLYELAIATAEKELAIDSAAAEQQFQIDRVNKVDLTERQQTQREAIAAAVYTQTVSVANATKQWQDDEATDRKAYTLSEAAANRNFTQSLASLSHTHATQVALAAETRDHTKATAAGNFWLAETTARNTLRLTLAAADTNLWTAQENARVTAHQSLHSDLALPWTGYLVAAATARRDWWAGFHATYVGLAVDRNSAETIYTGRLVTAYVDRQQQIATAQKTHALTAASTQQAADNGRADAIHDYITVLATPAVDYVHGITLAERTHAIAIAQAHKDFATHQDNPLRQQAIEAAGEARKAARQPVERSWFAAESSAQATKFSDFATVDRDAALDTIAADVLLANAKTQSEKLYRNEETSAYLQSTTSWANLDAIYRQYEASTFAAAAVNLATSAPSPWAVYEAADHTARAVRVSAQATALRDQTIAQAAAQAVAETARVNADATWQTAQTIASGLYQQAVAHADHLLAGAQSLGIAALGAAGVYRTALPHLSSPPDLSSTYAIGPASSDVYSVYLSPPSSVPTWYWQYHYLGSYGWNWGGWGYYGSGPWWASSPWLATSWLRAASSVHLASPTEQFNNRFWNLPAHADAASSHDFEFQWRYSLANHGSPLFGQSDPPRWTTTGGQLSKTFQTATNTFSNDELVDTLQAIDPNLADFWNLRGGTSRVEIGSRQAIAGEFITGESRSATDRPSAGWGVSLVVPSHWETWRAAKLIYDVANGFASPERLNGLNESYHDFVDQWISIPAEEDDTSGAYNNPFEDAGANVIEVALGGVDPENVPIERVNQMLQSGQAVEFERRIGLSTYTAIGMWVALSDGSFRSLVLEKVRHWFSSPTWQIVGVGPGKTMSLEQIVDSFVFSPKAASSAQAQANAAQFVLHVIPLGGFADHLSQGDYKEAVISIASDAATLLTGGGSKAISATRAAKSLGATQAGLRTAGLASVCPETGVSEELAVRNRVGYTSKMGCRLTHFW